MQNGRGDMKTSSREKMPEVSEIDKGTAKRLMKRMHEKENIHSIAYGYYIPDEFFNYTFASRLPGEIHYQLGLSEKNLMIIEAFPLSKVYRCVSTGFSDIGVADMSDRKTTLYVRFKIRDGPVYEIWLRKSSFIFPLSLNKTTVFNDKHNIDAFRDLFAKRGGQKYLDHA
jgi:hypothetical protein